MVDIVRMTVIPEDFVVQINGEPRTVLDMSSAPANLHAMQWYETWGNEEFNAPPGQPLPPSQNISNLNNYQTLIALWEAAAPIPDPAPTPADITAGTLFTAQYSLQGNAWYAMPGVAASMSQADQDAMNTWIGQITDIITYAQNVLANNTGEAYEPTFPAAPTLNPNYQGNFFLVTIT